jgi:hypothetical protein
VFVRRAGASVLHPRRVSIMPQQRACAASAVITSSREIDERSEREWGRERRHGDGVRGACGYIFVQQLRCRSKAAAIFRYRGGRLGSISSHG